MPLLAHELRRRRSFRAERRRVARSADAAIKRFTYLLKGRRLTVVDRYLERSLGTIHHPNGVGFNLVEPSFVIMAIRVLARLKWHEARSLSATDGGCPFGFARLFYHYVKTDAQGNWSARRLCQIVNVPCRSLQRLSSATTKVTHINRKTESGRPASLSATDGGCPFGFARLFYHYVKTDAQRKLVRTASLPNCQCPLSEPATAKQRHYEGDAHH